jgi:hypothetical protein
MDVLTVKLTYIGYCREIGVKSDNKKKLPKDSFYFLGWKMGLEPTTS